MSSKKEIFEVLKKTKIPVSYNESTTSALPKMVMSFVSSVSSRLSNKKHNRYLRYQVMYYSDRALDIETDTTLINIETLLEEKGFITTDWMEITDIDIDSEIGSYDYLIEVIG